MPRFSALPLFGSLCRALMLLACAGHAAMAGGILEIDGIRLQVRVSGERELIYNPPVQGCDRDDITDVPLRMIRRTDGTVVAYGSHYTTRLFHVQPDGRMSRDCAVVMRSEKNADPTRFSDMTWLSAFWTFDGTIVYALADNEYHAHKHPGQCRFTDYQRCWYSSIVNAVSFDGGKTFRLMDGSLPVAIPAFDHQALQGEPRGFFTPTNLIERGGYFYTLIFTTGGGSQKRGNCLFRTRRLNSAEDWQYLTDSGFVASARNPYRQPQAGEEPPPCKVIPIPGERIQSIVRHEASGLYLLTMTRRATPAGPSGVYLLASRDLVTWSKPVHVLAFPLRYNFTCTDGVAALDYPSLIDPRSPDRNFQTSGDRPFIYATEIRHVRRGDRCDSTMDRVLTRYPVEISAAP